MKFTRKMLALLLAVLMLVSMVPVSVFADDEDTSGEPASEQVQNQPDQVVTPEETPSAQPSAENQPEETVTQEPNMTMTAQQNALAGTPLEYGWTIEFNSPQCEPLDISKVVEVNKGDLLELCVNCTGASESSIPVISVSSSADVFSFDNTNPGNYDEGICYYNYGVTATGATSEPATITIACAENVIGSLQVSVTDKGDIYEGVLVSLVDIETESYLKEISLSGENAMAALLVDYNAYGSAATSGSSPALEYDSNIISVMKMDNSSYGAQNTYSYLVTPVSDSGSTEIKVTMNDSYTGNQPLMLGTVKVNVGEATTPAFEPYPLTAEFVKDISGASVSSINSGVYALVVPYSESVPGILEPAAAYDFYYDSSSEDVPYYIAYMQFKANEDLGESEPIVSITGEEGAPSSCLEVIDAGILESEPSENGIYTVIMVFQPVSEGVATVSVAVADCSIGSFGVTTHGTYSYLPVDLSVLDDGRESGTYGMAFADDESEQFVFGKECILTAGKNMIVSSFLNQRKPAQISEHFLTVLH